jgi:hypothetical protein
LAVPCGLKIRARIQIRRRKCRKTAPAGMSQEDWDKELERCNEVGAEMLRRKSLPPDQLHGLPDIHTEREECARRLVPVQYQYFPTRPIYTDTIPAVQLASPTIRSNLTSDPSARAVNSSSSQSDGTSVWQRSGPRVPLKVNPPASPEPAASDSLLDLSPPSRSDPPARPILGATFQ